MFCLRGRLELVVRLPQFHVSRAGAASSTEGFDKELCDEGVVVRASSAARSRLLLSVQVMEKEKIMKSQSQIKHANQEKMIMMGLEHPNIVRLWYAFQTPSKMCVAILSCLCSLR